jgi:hypothetical protein
MSICRDFFRARAASTNPARKQGLGKSIDRRLKPPQQQPEADASLGSAQALRRLG